MNIWRKTEHSLRLLPLLLLPGAAGAADESIKDAADSFKSLNQTSVENIFLNFATWFLGIMGTVAVLVVLWSAFLYMTASSDEQSKKAKTTLIYALIGVAVAILSYSVVAFTKSFLAP